MENMSSEPKHRIVRPAQTKPRRNFRFVVLLALIAFVQQFSFASLYHSFGFLETYSKLEASHQVQKAPTHPRDTRLGLNIDIEIAEEDDVQHSQDQCCDDVQRRQVEELRYSSFLKSRYLRSGDFFTHKADLPFFILYHSWKSDLS
jgi:hypothetical protein